MFFMGSCDSDRTLSSRHVAVTFLFLILTLTATTTLARAQDNYEIQVYGSDLVDPGHTMVELHSNFTIDGSKTIVHGVYPTNHAEHETVEITHGFNDWFECGFYIFTSVTEGQSWQWVGDHIRPRVAVPKKWRWPVGVSLSMEFGYQRALFSPDTWTMELRPIIDKQIGRWYFTVNPALERSFHGPSVPQGVGFSPSAKFSYDFNKYISGAWNTTLPTDRSQMCLRYTISSSSSFRPFDLNVSPNWEINFGVGIGATVGTDHLIVKGILGRRFDWTHHRAGSSDSTQ